MLESARDESGPAAVCGLHPPSVRDESPAAVWGLHPPSSRPLRDESPAADAYRAIGPPLALRMAPAEDDLEDDEAAPLLLDSTLIDPELRLRSQREMLPWAILPWLLGLVVVSSVARHVQTVILFSYLRTLQRCDSEPAAAEAAEAVVARVWTGSAHCSSRSSVVLGAQVQSAVLTGAGMLLHAAALPVLGGLGDLHGRRALLALDFGGMAVAATINALFPTAEALWVSTALQMLTGGFAPALAAMVADRAGMDARMGTCAPRDRRGTGA